MGRTGYAERGQVRIRRRLGQRRALPAAIIRALARSLTSVFEEFWVCRTILVVLIAANVACAACELNDKLYIAERNTHNHGPATL